MPSSRSALATVFALLAPISQVAGHGYVITIDAEGQTYEGLNPSYPQPPSVGWTEHASDLGFIAPDAYTTGDIICHKEATPAANSVKVNAGDKVDLIWNTWPESHHGPILDYLAPCNGNCSAVDKNSLSFFKIAESGLISGSNTGTWATDNLIANGLKWSVTIPSSIAPGNYVLRHEIIALHSAGNDNGAQNYPQCINLEVAGSGTETPSGEPATSFYTPTDPGIKFNLYTTFSSYDVPGPDVFSGGSSGSSGSAPTTSTPANTTVPSATAPLSSASAVSSAAAIASSATGSASAPAITGLPSGTGASAPSGALPVPSAASSALAPIISAISQLPSSVLTSAAPVATGTTGSGSTISTEGMSVAQLLDLLKEILVALFQNTETGAAKARRHAREF